ncbi:MAG: hypothetical protein IVW56_01715 [Candidatus Binataceae bacterium]|nr:hypothetical protein [Candidatus Binataceae bacterium]
MTLKLRISPRPLAAIQLAAADRQLMQVAWAGNPQGAAFVTLLNQQLARARAREEGHHLRRDVWNRFDCFSHLNTRFTNHKANYADMTSVPNPGYEWAPSTSVEWGRQDSTAARDQRDLMPRHLARAARAAHLDYRLADGRHPPHIEGAELAAPGIDRQRPARR